MDETCGLCGTGKDLVLDVPVVIEAGDLSVRKLCGTCVSSVLAVVTDVARKMRGGQA